MFCMWQIYFNYLISKQLWLLEHLQTLLLSGQCVWNWKEGTSLGKHFIKCFGIQSNLQLQLCLLSDQFSKIPNVSESNYYS